MENVYFKAEKDIRPWKQAEIYTNINIQLSKKKKVMMIIIMSINSIIIVTNSVKRDEND